MLDPSATSRWYLKIPPPIWALAILLLAYGLERNFGWAAANLVRSLPLAIAFGAFGLSGAAWAVLSFLSAGTEIEPASVANKKLVTRGPFRATRNPMYLGLFLMTLGIAFYRGTLSFFLVPICIFLVCDFIFIPFEEAKMRRQFGDQYEEYCARVRRWI